jgi:hypothetical protein
MTTIGVSVYPVIGELAPFALGTGTQFCTFQTATVHGLARVEERADRSPGCRRRRQSGRGDFRRFLDELKRNYETICVWEIWNQELNAMLGRRGFKGVREEVDGDLVQGLRWDKP